MEYKWKVLTNTTFGTLMASLDSNIVIIALPTIARQLPDTNLVTLLWILLGYALVTSVVLLNFGRLGDMFGRVRLYVLGFAIFTIGSALCGFSQTGIELVGFRMVQSIGAGFLFANSAAIITDAFPASERGKALGVNQVSIVVGAVSGLVLGGVLTTLVGWRWIFFVNVPIGIIATIRARVDLKELGHVGVGEQIDWLGNLTFGFGLLSILLGVTLGALGVVPIVGLYIGLGLGGALIAAFLYIETLVPHPMFDLSLLKIRLFSASITAIFINAVARGAFSFVMVFYLQGPPHFLSPLTAGLFLIPVSASLAACGPVSGWLSDRYGSRPFATLGLCVSAAGFLLLTRIGPTTSFPGLVGPFVLVGAGMGLFASPNRAAMMSSVPGARRGVASGIGTTLVNSGVTLSLGLAILIMSRIMPLGNLTGIFLGTTHTTQFAFSVSQFMTSVHTVFLISAILLLIAVIPSAMRGREQRSGPEVYVPAIPVPGPVPQDS
jgi:EmrB/QacA subfamily drug resistance transporter